MPEDMGTAGRGLPDGVPGRASGPSLAQARARPGWPQVVGWWGSCGLSGSAAVGWLLCCAEARALRAVLMRSCMMPVTKATTSRMPPMVSTQPTPFSKLWTAPESETFPRISPATTKTIPAMAATANNGFSAAALKVP